MGGCQSSDPGAAATAHIDAQLAESAAESEAQIKLLLLGAGESGKSTIFKQMRILYGKGFQKRDRELYKPMLHANLITNIKTLLDVAEQEQLTVQPSNAGAREAMLEVSDNAVVDAEVAGLVRRLWADPAVRAAFDRRAAYQVTDSCAVFFDDVDRIAAADFVPSVSDVLRVRVRTTGIIEEHFEIDQTEFRMYDVGGQRNERRKWLHAFDGVTAVIFVVAISEYDQRLFEDHSQNRLDEALTLFREISNSTWFANTSMILFLNKRDLFEAKIKSVDIRDEANDRYTDYTHGLCTCGLGYPSEEPCTCGVQDAAKMYMQNLFVKQQTSDKTIYPHITCATDTNNVKHVFNACKDIILQRELNGSGFL